MAKTSRRPLSLSAMIVYLSICVGLMLVLAGVVWESHRDRALFRATMLESEIERMRSHAERIVGRIEQDFELNVMTDLAELDSRNWLRQEWQHGLRGGITRFYAAVVTPNGEVLLHSEPSRRGAQLSRNWYRRVLEEVGDDVVETLSPVLTLGGPAYDLRVPIKRGAHQVGQYHAGFNVDGFEAWTAEKQAPLLRRGLYLVGGVLLILLLVTASLYFLVKYSVAVRRQIRSASIQRATEVGKLAAGLAHEIRNPLHAIQLNLHTFRRAHERQVVLPPEEVTKMLEQSIREIDRIEQLMQQLVGFAIHDEPRSETVDLTSEIREVVEFVQQEALDKNIKIQSRLPHGPLRARIDRGRLRQIMLNLLQNAQQAMERGGQIEVGLSRRRGRAQITISDNGPGISDEDRERIFEPFFSTKSHATGLGLTLVKRFIDEVDAEIFCESNSEDGVTFRILLHEVGRQQDT